MRELKRQDESGWTFMTATIGIAVSRSRCRSAVVSTSRLRVTEPVREYKSASGRADAPKSAHVLPAPAPFDEGSGLGFKVAQAGVEQAVF